MFALPKQIALNPFRKGNYNLQKTLINFYKPHFQTGLTKILKIEEKRERLQHFGLENSLK